ncbi:hypothetical protein GUJ93_ZPchr0013g35371 [Zizania palustris]|uniref:Beta-Casp domain-containing protein n=1 Tax=Zizania palustris TaxID=103762 RepID=A0A8J5WTQ7_ZIZPA|nr:hypothetical protein GUJ93_ZPchr0013g35371 [Zizania palustris]
MKLTCLDTSDGGGYYMPASHLLELEGLRILLDCPIDLSALTVFSPVPLGAFSDDVGDLIRAVPYYRSPTAVAAAKAGGLDAVLVSSATGLLGLPFLTRLPSFVNTKVYVTDVAASMGRLMMTELVEMHREFVRCYGPDMDGSPVWIEGEKVKKLLSVLQKSGVEYDGDDLSALLPLYSLANIEECMQKIQHVKYGEENMGEHMVDETNTFPFSDSVFRDVGIAEGGNIKYLCSNDDITEEIERISFICSCINDAINSGGSVLIPIGRFSVILLLLEHMSETLHSSNMKVPIFMISEIAEEMMAFTNALPEWLCKSRQEKLFSGEALFGHVELLKEGKLSLFPHLYSKGLLAAWKEPCIVFCPHWSLRHGPAVHLLRRWRADKRCLLVLEQGVDAELTLEPFMPLAIQVLGCSFLSGIKVGKIDSLLGLLKPKLVLFPEGLKSLCPVKEKQPWSFLYYSKGKTVEVPNIREEFEVRLATELAFGLQPRQLDKTIAVAKLRAKLLVSNGQYMLAPAKSQPEQSERHLLHRETVDPSRALSALQEKGIVCSSPADDDNSAPTDRERTISVTSPGEALVKVASERTTIYCDDEKTAEHIYDALRSICNGI